MFHHRPTAIGGDSSNVMNVVSRPRSLIASTAQDENSNNIHLSSSKAAASDTTITTTPAAKSSSRPRRAFGDISNKKQAPNGGGGGGGKENGSNSSNSSSKASLSLVLKPSHNRSSSNASPRNNQQFQSRIPKTTTKTTTTTAGSSKQQRSHPWSAHKRKKKQSSASNINSSLSSSHRQVEFILPISTRRSSSRPVEPQEEFLTKPDVSAVVQAKPTMTTTPQVRFVEPVDDVELPAGRLWVDQLKTDDPLGEDDCLSTSSMMETLGRRTMWDDWKETMHQQWKEERLELELSDEREVQAQLDRVIRTDQQGLESLFDTIDALKLDGDTDNINLDLLLEDDDWSAPASSVDGTLALTFEI